MGDFSLTTFSSKGRLLQIEYALNAVNKGETAIGIKTKNGVVLGVEKKLSSILIDENAYHKIQNITKEIGAVYSGLGPDFRILCQKARKHSQEYFLKYRENLLVSNLCRETSAIIQEYTQSGGVRPFGVSLLVAGYDDEGPHLYQLDPSGAFYEWKATAIGKNFKNAKNFLEKRYTVDMELEEGIHNILLALKEGYEGEMNSKNIEIAIVGEDQIFRKLTNVEIQNYLDELE